MKKQLTAIGFELSDELEKYSRSKLAELARRVPRELRDDALCVVTFTQMKRGTDKRRCSMVLQVGGQKFRAQETTQHMYTALDIATVDVLQKLRDYRRSARLRSSNSSENPWEAV
jgi:ribosomal subunit interface protein